MQKILFFYLFLVMHTCSGNTAIKAFALTEDLKEAISDGLTYTKLTYVNKGVTVLHVVEVDSTQHRFDLCLAENQRDCVSVIAKHHSARVAINGANYRRGGPYNGSRLNLLQSSEACCFAGSFYAGAIVIDQANKLHLDFCKASPQITIQTKSKKIHRALDGINIPRTSGQIVMYDASFNNRYVYTDKKTLILKKTKNKLMYFVSESQKIKIPSTGFIVTLDADMHLDLQQEVLMDVTFSMNVDVLPQSYDVKTVLCGAGMLLKNNMRCNMYEEFSKYALNMHYGDEAAADFGDYKQQIELIENSHPRTAIGIKLNGNVVLLVADGRSAISAGLSLKELQDIFLQLGCCDALNIGGGGCSTLVMNNQLINKPSQGGERPVTEAVCIL